MKEKFSNSAIVSDYFPVADGDYLLTVVLENSVQQDFSYFDQDIKVATVPAATPRLYGPMLAYQASASNRLAYFPFKFQDWEIRFNPRREFGQNEKVIVFFAVDRNRYREPLKAEIEVKNPPAFGTYSKTYGLEWPTDRDFAYFNQELERMKPGAYELKVKLLTPAGVPLAVSESDLGINVNSQIPHPTAVFRLLPAENSFLFYQQLGNQYEKLGDNGQAETCYQKGLSQKPDYAPLVKDYANLLLRSGRFDPVLALVEAIRTQEKSLFDYHALRGRAFYYKQQYAQAAESLQEANKLYDSDVSVLNTLGLSYMQLGQNEEAKRVLRSSLKLKPDQKDIEEILNKIK